MDVELSVPEVRLVALPCRPTSLMDNMLQMLEKYADHLEEIVAERTGQLEEEKRRTDLLLYRMLPQYV